MENKKEPSTKQILDYVFKTGNQNELNQIEEFLNLKENYQWKECVEGLMNEIKNSKNTTREELEELMDHPHFLNSF